MRLNTTISTSTKYKLSQTLRSWLPILQSDLETLQETLKDIAKDNPFIEIKSASEVSLKKIYHDASYQKNAVGDDIERLNFAEKSLFEFLQEQIQPPLFPTKTSQSIALEIITHINDNGYFEGSILELSKKFNTSLEQIERVRKRFAYLQPSGVGAIDLYESFVFQLNDFELDTPTYETAIQIINDFENLNSYQNNPSFLEAVKIIKKMKNPPAIEYLAHKVHIIPDIMIHKEHGELKVRLNSNFYPDIVVDTSGVDESFDFVKQKVENAKSLVEALNLRKETLMKVALTLLDYQYDFFMGGDIKPMKLEDLSTDLDRHTSTISRAISNKYLSCDRGIFALKTFFTTAISDDGETSNATIKTYLTQLIEKEDRKKPLSDNKLAEIRNKKFDTKLGRRTITKYRISQNIGSSSDRKKQYLLKV